MKKIALGLIMIVLSLRAFAQDGEPKKGKSLAAIFCSFDVRYRWNHASDAYRADGISAAPISGNQTYDVASSVDNYDYGKASYGAGLGLNLTLGYMFNDHLGASLGIGADLAPKRYTFEYKETSSMGTKTETTNSSLKMPLFITPSVILSTGYNDPFQVYTRMGVVLPFGGKLITEYTENRTTGDIYQEDEEYDFYMSKGLQGALGASYRVSDQLNIFGEINGTSLTRYVKSSTITRAELNGVNEMDQWDVEDIETTYTPNYFYDPATQAATKPTPNAVLSIPSSNFGISVGASLGFGSPVKIAADAPLKITGYIRAGFSYSMPHAGNYYNSGGGPISVTETYDAATTTTSADYKKGSYSAGISANIAAGYMFNNHLGAELGVNIGFSPTKYEAIFDEVYNTGKVETTIGTRSKMPVFLNPSLVLSTGANKPLSVYSRVGLAFPFGGNLIRTYTEVDNITNTTTVEDEEFDFYMSKGLTGALGARYNISDNIGLWGEVNGMSLTRYTKSSTVSSFTINGVDELGSLKTIQRQTEYDFNYTLDPANVNPDMPGKAGVIASPYSNFGISLGADFRF